MAREMEEKLYFGIEKDSVTSREVVHVFDAESSRDQWVKRAEDRIAANRRSSTGVRPNARRAASKEEADEATKRMEERSMLPSKPVMHRMVA